MELSRSSMRAVAAYAAILGSIYILIGAVEFVTGSWDLLRPGNAQSILGVPADIFGGFSALVIGSAYMGGTPLWKGKRESLGFILIAVLLSAVFGAVYLFIICADGIGTLVSVWEGEEWTWEWLTLGTAGTGILRHEIWLALASLPLGYFALKATSTYSKNRRSHRKG